MVKKIKQFRFYNNSNINNNITAEQLIDGSLFLNDYYPILQLGIQTIPGTKIYLNGASETPIVIGATGIYELNLENTTGLIYSIKVGSDSLATISSISNAYIIIDIVYASQED